MRWSCTLSNPTIKHISDPPTVPVSRDKRLLSSSAWCSRPQLSHCLPDSSPRLWGSHHFEERSREMAWRLLLSCNQIFWGRWISVRLWLHWRHPHCRVAPERARTILRESTSQLQPQRSCCGWARFVVLLCELKLSRTVSRRRCASPHLALEKLWA